MSESKNKQINYAQIHWSDQSEPISTLFDDVYFNTEEGIEESFYVFFQGNQLHERWLECKSEHFSIAETGFGTGLNFLVTCLNFQKFLKQHPEKPLKRLFFSSFEKYPLKKQDLMTALQRWPSLKSYVKPLITQYPLALIGCHRIVFEALEITLDLWFGDVEQTLPTLYHSPLGIFDCWYLDGFAPSKNPDMWSESLFKRIAESCKQDATISSFTAAGFVRRGLITAGFTMNKRKGYGKKREMLIGLIETKTESNSKQSDILGVNRRVDSEDIALYGSGITAASMALSLIKRGYKVTLYCENASLTEGLTDTLDTNLYPLLNGKNSLLDQFYANSFLYTRNYINLINQFSYFESDLSGIQIPNSVQDECLIQQADFPFELIKQQQSLFHCKLGGKLNLKQFIQGIVKKTQNTGELTINLNMHLQSFSEELNSCKLQFLDQSVMHPFVIFTSPAINSNSQQITSLTPLPYTSSLIINNQIVDTRINKDLFSLTRTADYELCTAPLLSEILVSQISMEPLPITNEMLNALQAINA